MCARQARLKFDAKQTLSIAAHRPDARAQGNNNNTRKELASKAQIPSPVALALLVPLSQCVA